jgi:hypothetical protein
MSRPLSDFPLSYGEQDQGAGEPRRSSSRVAREDGTQSTPESRALHRYRLCSPQFLTALTTDESRDTNLTDCDSTLSRPAIASSYWITRIGTQDTAPPHAPVYCIIVPDHHGMQASDVALEAMMRMLRSLRPSKLTVLGGSRWISAAAVDQLSANSASTCTQPRERPVLAASTSTQARKRGGRLVSRRLTWS